MPKEIKILVKTSEKPFDSLEVYRAAIMVTRTMTLQQIIDDRISFLREQINLNNDKPEVNSSFQKQIDAIKAVEDYSFEKVESIIEQIKLY